MDERATGTPSSSAVHTIADELAGGEVGAALEPGARVERYVVLHTLGRGAMGTVYAALDPMLDRRVALKLLRVGASRDPARAKARLLAEAQAMAQVSSPNVVTVHDVGEIDGGVFVAMELIDGATLREHVLEHAPPWRARVALLLQAATGLAAVHRAGLVHRDVKPDNIMVGSDGRVRLMDLGIAQRLGTSTAPEDSASSSGAMAALTRAAGTPPYMAPELQSEAASPASDQFALATTAFELLWGALPFTGRSMIERAAAALTGPPAMPADRRGVPRAVFDVIARGLAGDPSARWRSIDGFAAALESAAGRRRRLALAAAVVTAIGLGTAATLRTGEPPAPCPDPAPLLATAWNPEAAAALAAGLQARRGPASTAFVLASWARVSQALDEFAQRWRDSHRELCAATRVRHERSEQALDHGMACLAQQRARFETLIELVGTGDHETLRRAVESAAALPDPRVCEASTVRAGEEPSVTRDAALEAIARADQRIDLGELDAGLVELESIADAARERGDGATLAMALTQRGLGLSDAERVEAAEATLIDGFVEAQRAQFRESAVDAALGLAFLRSRQQGRQDDAQLWLRLAAANLPESQARSRRAAALADAEGVLALDRFDDLAALRAFDRALELLEGEGDLDELGACSMYDHRATAAQRLGHAEDALADYDRARAACVAVLGPDHPRSATPLANRAQVELGRGELDLARAHIAEATAVVRAAGAIDRVAMMEHNLGVIAAMQQDNDAAEAAFASALRTIRERRGPQHPDALLPLVSLAQVIDGRGDHEAAAALWDEALALARGLGPDHVAAVEPLMGKAENLRATGQPAAALPLDDEALRLAERAGARDLLASACIGAALGRRAIGRGDEAEALLRRAIEASQSVGDAALEAEARALLADAPP